MSTETTVTSWGERVGGSIKGIGVGFLAMVAGVVLLFWNEGRTIQTKRMLDEGAKTCVSVDANSIDAAMDGKLVHISGNAETSDELTDSEFNISLNAFQLDRKVEVYQWQEKQETKTRRLSGGKEERETVYSYYKTWSDELIDASAFHDSGYENPTQKPYESQTLFAQNASVGAFSLSQEQIKRLGPVEDFDPNASAKSANDAQTNDATEEDAQPQADDANDAAAIYAAMNGAYAQDFSVNSSADTNADFSVGADAANDGNLNLAVDGQVDAASALPSELKPYANGYYIGDPKNAQIGDARITFSYVKTPSPASFVAQQSGNSLVPYKTKNGKMLELQSEGIKTADEMFDEAKRANKLMAWILRAVGALVVFIGLKMIFQPLATVADIVPFASKIVGFGTGLAAGFLAIFISLVTIAVGWLYYRPVLGVSLLVVAFGFLIAAFAKKKKVAAQ